MENERQESLPLEEEVTEAAKEVRYVPRPRWQVWAARVALVLFLLMVLGYYLNIARGGA